MKSFLSSLSKIDRTKAIFATKHYANSNQKASIRIDLAPKVADGRYLTLLESFAVTILSILPAPAVPDFLRRSPISKGLGSLCFMAVGLGMIAGSASAAPLNNTDIYVNYSTNSAAINQIRTISPSGVLSPLLFTTGVSNTAALGLDPISLQLYYSDRTLIPNNLRRYDGTTESSSLGTFAGSNNSTIPMVRMGFRGSVGYGISNDNTVYTFTTGSPTSTITPLGTMSFLGTSPSGVTNSGDIAFDGYGFGWAIFGNSLYRINLKGGVREAIPIGQITVGGSVLPVTDAAGTGVIVGSIAFDSVGGLYIAGLNSVANVLKGTNIYKVDVNDATAVQVGSTFNGGFITDMASGSQPNIAPIVTATKSVSPTGLAMPGDTLTYTIEVENTGTAPAVNLDFTDVLPASTTYVANSATLNGVAISGATYPFATATRINGRNSSTGSLKVGNANRATITFKVTINTTNVPSSIVNQGTIVYLDSPTSSTNPTGSIPTSTAGTTVTSPVTGYKSVKLTNDADGSGSITPGDTVTWTISYKNQSTVAVNSFQINDPLPTGVTLTPTGGQTVTVSGTGTSATKNTAYTGASTGAVSNLLNTATLSAGGVVTVNIPTVVTSGFTGTLSNQPNATGSSIPGTGTLTDNVDNTTSVPAGVTVPTGSVTQTQTTAIDPTKITVEAAPPTTSFKDRINSCGLITFDSNSEGFRAATITDNGTNYNAFTITPKSAPYANGTAKFQWQSIGNPGGSIFTDDLDGQWTIFTTPDFGTDTNFSFLNSKSLTFDYRNDTGISGAYDFWVALVDKNGNKVFYSFKTQLSGASTTAFSKVVVPMDATKWFTTFQTPTSAAPTSTVFAGILSNLDRIDIGAEGISGPDHTEIDNIGMACDHGDAPNTYGTLAAANGPSHQITSALKLGTKIDAENDGQPTSDAKGDDQDLSASNRIGVIDDEDGITAFPALTVGRTNYSIPAANITAVNTTGGAAKLHAWIDFNKNGTFEATEYTSTTINTSGAATGPLSWTTGFTIGSSGSTFARFRLTTDASITANTPGGSATDGEVEDYEVSISNPANVLLLKRITAINGLTTNPNDNTLLTGVLVDPNWTAGYVIGATNGGKVKPGDTIEYTIYYLNNGGRNAKSVRICDRLNANQTFQPNTYPDSSFIRNNTTNTNTAGSGMQVQKGTSAALTLTNTSDSDGGQFIAATSPVTAVPTNCNSITGAPNNDYGTLILDLVTNPGSPNLTALPAKTSLGAPNDSFGFWRFITKVNP